MAGCKHSLLIPETYSFCGGGKIPARAYESSMQID